MIILAATPIGNDGDASPRFRSVIESADVIAAEDTRRFLNLAGRLGLNFHGHVIAFHDHNEADKAPELIEAALRGENIVVVSDAGMPVISDPGFRLVNLAAHEGVEVDVVPGPSAVLTALAISGFSSRRFAFEGFPPRKEAEQIAEFSALAREKRTLIFFESPRRLGKTLIVMRDTFGSEREGAICRELTKTYQEVQRGTLAELAQWAQSDIRGEIVIVVSGAPITKNNVDRQELVKEVGELVELGVRAKAAAAHIARREGVRPNELFEAYLAEINKD